MLVYAPVYNASFHVSLYADLWKDELVTLGASQRLLEGRCFFINSTISCILEKSLSHHEEVTDTLGEQVKRAAEVLVKYLDKAD